MIFDILKDNELKCTNFSQKQEFLINDFLPKQLITLIYADGGMGKSMLAQAISSKLTALNQECFTIDLDNPMSVLEERGINLAIKSNRNFHYISRASLNISPTNLLDIFDNEATGVHYKDKFFVFDSLVNFVDIYNEARVNKVFEVFKNMREAGATILILHHSNKDGKNYQGVNTIRNAVDCMYQLSKRPSSQAVLNFLLEVRKERAGIKDKAYTLDLKSFEIVEMDGELARMSEYELDFTNKAKKILKNGNTPNKTELLRLLGFEKDDKTARDVLDKFDGKIWLSSKQGKEIIYGCA